VATVLSAQCTDERVNGVTPELFRRFPTPGDLAAAPRDEVEALVRPTGFFRQKARYVQEAAAAIDSEFGGRVPATMADLLALPGVARKTANVVLGVAFAREEGIVVDTHVGRVSRRLGLTSETDPRKVEADLMALVPRGEWVLFAHLLIMHGRRVCRSRRPQCPACPVADLCPSAI